MLIKNNLDLKRIIIFFVASKYYKFAVLISILLLSESVNAVPKPISIKIAQQPANTSQETNSIEAATLYQEGVKLYQQGSQDSLRQAIKKFEQALRLYQKLGDRQAQAPIIGAIGTAYNALGEREKALEYFNQALKLAQELKDTYGEAATLFNIAFLYSGAGEKQKAVDYFNQVLTISRTIKNRDLEARTLFNIGITYEDTEKVKAIEYHKQALPIAREVGNKPLESFILLGIGKTLNELGEKQQALDYFTQRLEVARALNDPKAEAYSLTAIGAIYQSLREYPKALEYLNQALPIARKAGDKDGEANTLSNIAGVYNSLGENQKAIEYYNQVLPIIKAGSDRTLAAKTLNNIGRVYNDFGETQKALEYYNQSLQIAKTIGDRNTEATALHNIGMVYNVLGEKQKAFDYLNAALPLRKAIGDIGGEAATLYGIAIVYQSLDEKQKALEYYNQTLPLARKASDRLQESAIFNNLGAISQSLGEKQKALEYYNQAIAISEAIGAKLATATTLSSIGNLYLRFGEQQKALDYLNRSLPLRKAVGDSVGEAVTLNIIGNTYSAFGQKEKAIEYYNQALPLTKAIGDAENEAATLSNFALVQRSQGKLEESLKNIEAALKIIENLRTKVASQELRTSYFASRQYYYQFYIDLLMELNQKKPSQGYDAKALQASERARARSLLDILAEARADIRTGADPKLVEKERYLQDQLNIKEQQRVKLFLNEQTKTKALDTQKEIESLLAQYEQLKAEIRNKSPRYAALTQPQPISLKEIQQQVLDDNTVLLEYSLGEDRSYLWAVTKTSITSYELPKRSEIEAAVRRFRETIITPKFRARPKLAIEAASTLSQMILQPVANQLGNKRLLIVSDGALQYVPFTALAIPGKSAGNNGYVPLVLENEIVNLPSASTLAVLRQEQQGRQPAKKTVAVLADPVFGTDDGRLKNKSAIAINKDSNQVLTRAANDSGVNFARLEYTQKEAAAIASLVTQAEKTEALGFEVNRATVTNPKLSEYRIIHFATHGILNSQHPELSGLVLSLLDEKGEPQNGFLRLHDIYNLNLPVELIVLSACQTGLGKEIKGEGLVGLTRGFMYAGASRVVVSLWSVSDEGTAELMKRFYQKMLSEKLKPAAALRAAQMEMLQTEEWNSPFYWAAFMLQGEWN